MFEDEHITFLRNLRNFKPATWYHIPEEPDLGHVRSLVGQIAVRNRNSHYYGANFAERKFFMTEESLSINPTKFFLSQIKYIRIPEISQLRILYLRRRKFLTILC
jgi:hypothetical protein